MENSITLFADMLGIREIYIEKDYWLCMILRNLAHSDPEIFNRIVFKLKGRQLYLKLIN